MKRLTLFILGLVFAGQQYAQDLPKVEYLGRVIVTTETSGNKQLETTIGGLSGLEFDPQRSRFYALSDKGPARFYTLDISLEPTLSVTFEQEVQLDTRAIDQANKLDPEAIRLAEGGNSLFWTSEHTSSLYQSDLNGTLLATYPRPDWLGYYPQNSNLGVKRNNSFESLARSQEAGFLFLATENSLKQDDPCQQGQELIRILQYDLDRKMISKQWLYPIRKSYGLVELLSQDKDHLIAVERAYSPLKGTSIQLFLVELATALETPIIDNLCELNKEQAAVLRPVLLYDFDQLKEDETLSNTDNIEGLSWGPKLEDGSRTLVLVSDDNFNPLQLTHFLFLKLED